MSKIELKGVQDTLFIPLMARKYVSEVFPEFFYDEKALEITSKIPPNSIIKNSSEYTIIASVARSTLMDSMVKDFLHKYHKSNIVCIGCGLETTAWRLEAYKERMHFYEIDFESVIRTRRELLGVLSNETLISGDISNLKLTQYTECSTPTLFVVSGVFEYFKEEQVVKLIHKLQGEFKNAEMIFDTVSNTGLKFSNRYVKKTGNKDAQMYFSINEGLDFAKLSNTKLITQQSIYTNVPKHFKNKLKLYTRLSMYINDTFNMSRIFHLAL